MGVSVIKVEELSGTLPHFETCKELLSAKISWLVKADTSRFVGTMSGTIPVNSNEGDLPQERQPLVKVDIPQHVVIYLQWYIFTQ